MTDQPTTETVDPAGQSGRDAYRLFISAIIPRPVAWVSTVRQDGALNLAPFSFFNGISGDPPTVMFAVEERDGGPKDTLRNIEETGECVVNMADRALSEAMVHTAGEWDYGISEFEQAGLETAPSDLVRPPRVAAAPVAMEARVLQLVPIPDSGSTLVLARILRYHIRQGLLLPNGTIDPLQYDPIGRLGRANYTTLGEILTILRPQV
jgi:flavin reductase (DIM6/NTAB) family NADH-FMN oxidoreductase RutF